MDIFDFFILAPFIVPGFLVGYIIGRIKAYDEDTHKPQLKEIEKYRSKLELLKIANNKAKKMLCNLMNNNELLNKPLGEIVQIYSIWKVR